MSDNLIRYANIVVGNHGQVMIAIRDSGLDPNTQIEVHLKIGNTFEIFQGIDLIGQIDHTPDEAMMAIAACKKVVLVEVATDAPVRIHEMVAIRNSLY